MPQQPIALRVRRPEALKDALAEAPTFEAEELLYRIDRIARDLSSDIGQKADYVRLYCDAIDAQTALSEAELASTWQRLCETKARGYRHLVQATRRDGRVALGYGVVCFVGALAVAILAEQWEPLPRWINRPLSEGFTIAAWVSLWRPMELLLYEWLPFGRMAKTLEKLADLPVEVGPTQAGPPRSA